VRTLRSVVMVLVLLMVKRYSAHCWTYWLQINNITHMYMYSNSLTPSSQRGMTSFFLQVYFRCEPVPLAVLMSHEYLKHFDLEFYCMVASSSCDDSETLPPLSRNSMELDITGATPVNADRSHSQ